MDRLDYGSSIDSVVERPARTKNSKKRKWREIETLMDRQRLMKELEDIDSSFEFDPDTII